MWIEQVMAPIESECFLSAQRHTNICGATAVEFWVKSVKLKSFFLTSALYVWCTEKKEKQRKFYPNYRDGPWKCRGNTADIGALHQTKIENHSGRIEWLLNSCCTDGRFGVHLVKRFASKSLSCNMLQTPFTKAIFRIDWLWLNGKQTFQLLEFQLPTFSARNWPTY